MLIIVSGVLRTERDDFALQLSKSVPQGLKPGSLLSFTARLKSCPDTKHESSDYQKRTHFRRFVSIYPSLKVLTQTLKPDVFSVIYGPTKVVP